MSLQEGVTDQLGLTFKMRILGTLFVAYQWKVQSLNLHENFEELHKNFGLSLYDIS